MSRNANIHSILLGIIRHRCWHGKAPRYLVDCCTPVSPMLSVGSDSGQQHSNWWWCHDTGFPRLAAEHLLCTVPWSGTPCLTTSAHSRTMFLLNRAWKPDCSLGTTSVHSALETFVTMRYINLHLPLPYNNNRPAWFVCSNICDTHMTQCINWVR